MAYSPSDIQRTLTLSKFRVKIKSLAEEARIIRREEQRYKTHIVEYAQVLVPYNPPEPMTNGGMTHTWRTRSVVVKTYEHNDFVRQQLREHRTKDLRSESLYTLLAYAFYRNKPVSSVIVPATTLKKACSVLSTIDRRRIMQMVERMQGGQLLRSEVDRFNQWAVEGKLPHQAGRVAYI